MMVDFKCDACGTVSEHFFHATESATVSQCPCECGATAARSREIRHAPAVVWTGSIGQRYRDKDKPGYHQPDGMNVYTRKTPDGKPKLVHLDSWSDVSRHCKSEGLVDPRSQPRNLEVSEDGKSSFSPRGMPGQEI